MKFLKSLIGWFSHAKTNSSLDIASKQPSVSDLFIEACLEAGVESSTLQKVQATKLFVEWYNGPDTKEAVLESITLFIEAHGNPVNKALKGYFINED